MKEQFGVVFKSRKRSLSAMRWRTAMILDSRVISDLEM